MKQFAVIGLGKFGRRMVEELVKLDVEVLIIDKDRNAVELHKDKVASAHIADVMNEQVLRKIIPSSVDGVIINVGDRIEVSILTTSHLKKMGIRNIIVTAESNEHGEILEIVGATQVVFPNWEAAKRIAPILVSSELFSYFPISFGLVMAEILLPRKLVGKSLIEADIRRSMGINIVAVRHGAEYDYEFFDPEYRMMEGDILLAVGPEEKIALFSGAPRGKLSPGKKKAGILSIFRSGKRFDR
jgi:trk system potassium uptake protein